MLDSTKSAGIDLVEAAYRLPIEESDWLEHVVAAGLSTMPHSLFASGITFGRTENDRRVRIRAWRHEGASDEIKSALLNCAAGIPKELELEWFRRGLVETGSCVSEDSRQFIDAFASKTKIAGDVLMLNAMEPDGCGAYLAIFLPDPTKLDFHERERWKMLGAHLAAGHRVWRAVGSAAAESTALPHGAEAVLDPASFKVTDVAGRGKEQGAAATLRESARQVDRARGQLRRTDPKEALETWLALMHGRWSMVDWFDSDQRRYVLAIPNAPDLGDPRGLSERELQVATYAALGESGKLISYRLGVSKGTVSNALVAGMRKLGVKTKPQLAEKMRGFKKQFGPANERDSNNSKPPQNAATTTGRTGTG
ncbi:MAG: helix-turn-helix transcriptional regulator [Polyangiales bacterium]